MHDGERSSHEMRFAPSELRAIEARDRSARRDFDQRHHDDRHRSAGNDSARHRRARRPARARRLDRGRRRRALRRLGLGRALVAVSRIGRHVRLSARRLRAGRASGRALAFLFNWQFLLYAPCLLASGYIGFANYAAYLLSAARQPTRRCTTRLPSAIGVVTIAAALSPHGRRVRRSERCWRSPRRSRSRSSRWPAFRTRTSRKRFTSARPSAVRRRIRCRIRQRALHHALRLRRLRRRRAARRRGRAPAAHDTARNRAVDADRRGALRAAAGRRARRGAVAIAARRPRRSRPRRRSTSARSSSNARGDASRRWS